MHVRPYVHMRVEHEQLKAGTASHLLGHGYVPVAVSMRGDVCSRLAGRIVPFIGVVWALGLFNIRVGMHCYAGT